MPTPKASHVSRRSLLAMAAAAPAARAVGLPLCFLPSGDDVVLLVVELVGGNDGLDTVLPVEDALWAKLRPTLSRSRRGAHRLRGGGADDLRLHRSMGRMAALYGDGDVAVVQGVGYTPPDRSHFRSRDIWHTARPTLRRPDRETTGWLGHACDLLAARHGVSTPGLSIGTGDLPLALRGRRVVVPALASLDDYTLRTGPLEDRRALERLAGSGSGEATDFIREVAREALRSERRLRDALARYRPRAEYPGDAFGRSVQLAGRVVASGFGTRILHTSLGGFDTHANEAATHAALLAQLDAALGAFADDLKAHGVWDRVVVLVHSEFGRRAAENASLGTDHGAAAPALVLGGRVRGAVHGESPDLERLEDGDVAVTCDFRRVYAECLAALGLGGADRDAVLGGAFEPLGLIG